MKRDRNPSVLLVGTHIAERSPYYSMGEELGRKLREDGWQVTLTSSASGRFARISDMLATVWNRRGDYDVAQVDVFSGTAFMWAEAVTAVLRRLGKPYVLALRGGNLPLFSQSRPRRIRRLLKSAHAVLAPSSYLIEGMSAYHTSITKLPNPIEVDAYSFRLREQAAPKLMWLRAFHRIYNPYLAPEVVAILARQFEDLQLVMVGPDKDGSLSRTKARARELGVQEMIQFQNGVPKIDVPSWLQRGDVFLNTTNIDNSPVSVLEAMACGLPVVSTNVGGIPYMVEHGEDALLVPPRDPEQMAMAVRRILSEAGLAARLSRSGRDKVEKRSWEVVLPMWQNIFRSASSG